MKIYVSHASGWDFRSGLYLPLRNSVLNREHTIILPHEHEGPPVNSLQSIIMCDVLFQIQPSPFS